MEKIRRKSIRSYLPHVRFLTVHYAYFIIVTLVCSGILWGSSTPAHSLRYIDALYLAVSAMTLAGMNTVNLSTLNTFQQLLLFFLIMSGSAVWSQPHISPSELNRQLMHFRSGSLLVWF